MTTPAFEFATAQRIIFGVGAFGQARQLAADLGRHVFLVAGGHALQPGGPGAQLADDLTRRGVGVTTHPVHGEPDVEGVNGAVEKARQAGADVVIGLGGGSALDTAKAVAGLLTNGGEPLDYMEVVGRGKALSQPGAPFIAIPTTAGPGSEVTRNAVVTSHAEGVKASIRGLTLLARVALLDPALTYSLPPDVTASTGLDALTQLIEPYVSRRANSLTDSLVMGVLPAAAQALPRAWANPDDVAARVDMARASVTSGLCLANSGLGAVHGFAAPLGGQFSAPHGVVCAILLAPVMEANVTALRAMDPDAPAGPGTAGQTLRRYVEVAGALTGEWGPDAIEAGITWARERVRQFGLPGLSHYGMTEADIPEMVRRGREASSMKGNPVTLSDDALAGILRAAL